MLEVLLKVLHCCGLTHGQTATNMEVRTSETKKREKEKSRNQNKRRKKMRRYKQEDLKIGRLPHGAVSIMFVLYLFWLWKNVLFFKGCIITVAEFGVCFNIKKYRKEFWPGHQHFFNYMLHFSTLWKINFFLKSLSNPACFTIEFWIHQSFSC